MPSIFSAGGYVVFFWSNEGNEPIHVHIAKEQPTANSTKVWLLEKGGCILAHNKSNIPRHDLDVIMDMISAHYFVICDKWKKFYCVEDISFYC